MIIININNIISKGLFFFLIQNFPYFVQTQGDVVESEEALFGDSRKSKERQPTGRVVGIVRRKWRQYCGILLPSVLKEGTRHLFVPAERKIPKIRIETRQAANLSSQKIIVAIDSWPR